MLLQVSFHEDEESAARQYDQALLIQKRQGCQIMTQISDDI